MTVIWTVTVVAHLEMIHAYLESQSAIYAAQTINRLVLAADALGDFPLMGRVVPELRDDRREVIQKPYRIVYRPTETQTGCSSQRSRQSRAGNALSVGRFQHPV